MCYNEQKTENVLLSAYILSSHISNDIYYLKVYLLCSIYLSVIYIANHKLVQGFSKGKNKLRFSCSVILYCMIITTKYSHTIHLSKAFLGVYKVNDLLIFVFFLIVTITIVPIETWYVLYNKRYSRKVTDFNDQSNLASDNDKV